ncbi:hypothetical protein AB0G06_43395 [Nonomuraea dietziae]|uniref:hypothetical protein n=1 Tax=Nonomuraea dietziae TaxID=65515 RepID=UPI0033F97A8B
MKLSGEWELGPEEIAALFRAKGWTYHSDYGLTVPTEDVIEAMLSRLIKEALTNTDAVAVQGGRFMVWKDPELPHSYDLFLNLGFIWDEDALDAEVAA